MDEKVEVRRYVNVTGAPAVQPRFKQSAIAPVKVFIRYVAPAGETLPDWYVEIDGFRIKADGTPGQQPSSARFSDSDVADGRVPEWLLQIIHTPSETTNRLGWDLSRV